MKEALLKIVKSPAVRTAFVGLVMAILAALGISGLSGCSSVQLAPALELGVKVADCQLDAVRALVPHAQTADQVVAAARVGDVRRAIALMLELGMSEAEIGKVADAFSACRPSPGRLPDESVAAPADLTANL